MTVINQLASQTGRNDDQPNKDLGMRLVADRDADSIQEIANNLWNQDKRIQVDCLSVLEQVGRLAPDMIEAYVEDFLQLITSKNNQLVWAAMINLALIADRVPEEIFARYEVLIRVIESGSVITVDNGIKVLGKVAATKPAYNVVIFPTLMEQLAECRPKSVPQFAESILPAVTPDNQGTYLKVLETRMNSLSATQVKRVQKILKVLKAR
jgi:hypothetical protein